MMPVYDLFSVLPRTEQVVRRGQCDKGWPYKKATYLQLCIFYFQGALKQRQAEKQPAKVLHTPGTSLNAHSLAPSPPTRLSQYKIRAKTAT